MKMSKAASEAFEEVKEVVEVFKEGKEEVEVFEVVKGEDQKADGALVPIQLWDQAFLRGYGQEVNEHLLRHQLALGISSDTPDTRSGFMEGPKPPDGWTTALGYLWFPGGGLILYRNRNGFWLYSIGI